MTILNFFSIIVGGDDGVRKVRESSVEKYLVKRCEEHGWLCLKFDPSHRIGMPDRLIVLPHGRVEWVELKTDGGELTEIQKYRHKELMGLGHAVHVVWSKDQADELIEEIKRPQRDLA